MISLDCVQNVIEEVSSIDAYSEVFSIKRAVLKFELSSLEFYESGRH